MSTEFFNKCYEVIKQIPRGRVVTYRDVAEALGTKAYRAVGQAMKRNPNAPRVPCHRVVCSDGTIGGYAAGVKKKRALLRSEGILLKNDKIVGFEKVKYSLKR